MDIIQITQILKSQLQQIDPDFDPQGEDHSSLQYYKDILTGISEYHEIESFRICIDTESVYPEDINENMTIIKFEGFLHPYEMTDINSYLTSMDDDSLLGAHFINVDTLILLFTY